MSYRRRDWNATAQALILPGTAVRIVYGLGATFMPQRMVAARLAPDTHDLPDPRLLLRAFGGHQLLIGGIALSGTGVVWFALVLRALRRSAAIVPA
jgi:uncharacterized protein YjeT (DUF2065 family)